MSADDLTGAILGIGFNAQMQNRRVLFIPLKQKTAQARGLVEHANQNPGGKRIQCAGMPDFAGAKNFFDAADDPCGRQALRLIQYEDAALFQPPSLRFRDRLQSYISALSIH